MTQNTFSGSAQRPLQIVWLLQMPASWLSSSLNFALTAPVAPCLKPRLFAMLLGGAALVLLSWPQANSPRAQDRLIEMHRELLPSRVRVGPCQLVVL